jgi:hypothetical protein
MKEPNPQKAKLKQSIFHNFFHYFERKKEWGKVVFLSVAV